MAGLLTRRYHGLLVAALNPPLGRTLLVTKFDETLAYDDKKYWLSINRWDGGIEDTTSPLHLDRFHLEGSIPVWTYACADALLEKRVWMEHGANTTYVRYDVKRATGPVSLTIKSLVNYRDYHSHTEAGDWFMDIEIVDHGMKVTAFEGATPFWIRSEQAQVELRHEWYKDYYLSVEAYRGLHAVEDHLLAGVFTHTFEAGDPLTLVISTDESSKLDGEAAYKRRVAYEETLTKTAALNTAPPEVRHLALAADQFIVKRSTPDVPDGHSIIAGYPWFSDWGRDTMIALPGLTLSTGRTDIAASILRIFAQYTDQGMLPNRFPDAGETPEYNTIDATLWYFEAVRAYHEATGDDELLEELYPVLASIIDWHQKGPGTGSKWIQRMACSMAVNQECS